MHSKTIILRICFIVEMENALPVFLGELLSAKRRRKDLHKTRQETEIDSRKLQEKQRKRQSRQVQDLHRKFPSLQKTLQEIQDFDLTLPTELFPTRDPSPIPTPSNQTPFRWNTHKARGLEEVFLKKEGVVESGRKRKRQMTAPPGEANDEGKRPRHLVIVNFEKCKSHVPSSLRHFHSAAVEASERIQNVEKARVRISVVSGVMWHFIGRSVSEEDSDEIWSVKDRILR